MTRAQKYWDFFFGVVLIGGAPLSMIALTLILGNLYDSTFKATTPPGVDLAIFFIMIAAVVYAFRFALNCRRRRRLLSRDLLITEVVLGIIWALAFFFYVWLHLLYVAI